MGEERNVLGSIRLAKAIALLAGCHFERKEIARGDAYLSLFQRHVERDEVPSHVFLFAELAAAEGAGAAARWDESLHTLGGLLAHCKYEAYDLREDVLYAAQRVATAAGRMEQADEYLTMLSDGMRSNAEAVICGFSRFVDTERDVAWLLREVDNVVNGLAMPQNAYGVGDASWANLIGMAASASMLEDGSGEHCVRVAALCGEVARELNLSPDSLRLLEQAALLHDIGKAASPALLLAKKEPLTDHEASLLARHAEDGGRLIELTSLPNRGYVAELVRLHHYPFDAVGESRGIRGEEIPLEARILSACDHFDALIAGRPRRTALSAQEALRQVLKLSGREFDPRVVGVLIESVRQILREHGDIKKYLSLRVSEYGYICARKRLLGTG